MNITPNSNTSFGHSMTAHLFFTEKAVEKCRALSKVEKRMLARFSQMPDVDLRETTDWISPHFIDIKYIEKDPCFGTKNDAKNNALSRFLRWSKKAAREKDRETFLRNLGYAVHYLQDAATPPHTEHGNYLHKLFRAPMHKWFEKGKTLGMTSKLELLSSNYVPKRREFKDLKKLFMDTAYFSVRPENRVRYTNIPKWGGIQQRCFNETLDVTKMYLDYMLKFLPPKA